MNTAGGTLWVVVPAYNEAAGIEPTLDALAAQHDADFTLCVVDNASTDGTPAVVERWAAAHPQIDLRLVTEPVKGTGAAADTGMRHAIAHGATHLARTDADCLPEPDWTAAVRRAFAAGLQLVSGKLLPRTDECRLRLWERLLLPAVVTAAGLFGQLRPGNRSPDYVGPYQMCPGCNMAITAGLYERSGGFPRAAIEDVHEDRELVNRVRRLTSAYGLRRDVRVRGSVRRLRAYGLRNTLAWYLDHRFRPAVVDVRGVRADPRQATRHERRVYLASHPVAYPLLRGLARLGPAVRVPVVGVVVNDAAVARTVLTDTARFRKDGPGSSGALWTPVVGPAVLLNMEGAEHTGLRRGLAELFTPGYVRGLCAQVLGTSLADLNRRLARREAVDLVEVIQVVTGTVISALCGLPEPDAAQARVMFARAAGITSTIRLRTRALSASQVRRARTVLGEVTAAAAAAYRAGDERTVPGRMRRLGLTEQEALGAVAAFFLTGTETIATFVPRFVAVLHDAGELDRVAGDRSLLDVAIAEAMRVITPSPVMLRRVAAAGQVGGVPVSAGDRVVIATHNCAIAAGKLDLSREHPAELRRLWFGAGAHFCIGYPLAMAEIHAVTGALLDHAPIRVLHRQYARGVLIPTYARLVVAPR